MEGPLLTKTDHTTIKGENSSDTDQRNITITIHDDSPCEAERAAWCSACPEEIKEWCSMDSVLSLVQIIAAIVVLILAKDEHPQTAVLVWIIGYTCASFFMFLNGFLNCVDLSIDEDYWKELLEFFFVGWVFVLFWICYVYSLSSLYDNTQHFWLCMAFLVYSCIRYVIANTECAITCAIFFAIIWIVAAAIASGNDFIISFVLSIVSLIILKAAHVCLSQS